jgi:hypothetical protein
MTVPTALNAAGRRRSPATLPGYHAGRPPRNNGQLYPADPPTVEEIVAVMRRAPDDRHGARLRALIVVLWRAGLRVQEVRASGSRRLAWFPRRGPVRVMAGPQSTGAAILTAPRSGRVRGLRAGGGLCGLHGWRRRP